MVGISFAVAEVGGEKPGLGWRDGTVVIVFMFPFKRVSLLKSQEMLGSLVIMSQIRTRRFHFRFLGFVGYRLY